jgi:hypothetical protein
MLFDRDVMDRFISKIAIEVDLGNVRVIVDKKYGKHKFEKGLKKAIVDYLEKNVLFSEEIDVNVSKEQEIVSREEAQANFDALLKKLNPKGLAEKNKKAFDAFIDNNPNNGKEGYWRVSGIRHCAVIWAKSARDAMNKAIKEQAVGDWEIMGECIHFIGERPEVI